VRALTEPTARLVRRALAVGTLPTDDEQTRLRKSGLMLIAWSVSLLATVWVLVDLVLGRPLSAAIPLTYQTVTIVSIGLIARFGWSPLFKTSQVILIVFLPALLMWTLGGFVSGSAVIIWAFSAPIGALIFTSLRQALIIFAAFIALVLVSGVIDPWLSANIEPLPDQAILLFFVLNIVAVGVVAMGGLLYFLLQRDRAQEELAKANAALDVERGRSEALLRNILPDAVAERLKDGEVVADRFEAVTVLFADIVGFTPMASDLAAEEVVGLLDRVYGDLDDLATAHGLVRIKTMGDAYMAAAGVPDVMTASAGALAATGMSLAMLEHITDAVPDVQVRIGLHTGPAVAGVIGRRTYAYDIWGAAVNIASRMESHGIPGRVQVSAATYELITAQYECEPRGTVQIKGVGPMETYLVRSSGQPTST
jgi:adenylate cyclase